MVTWKALVGKRLGRAAPIGVLALGCAVALLGAACTGGGSPKAGPSPTGTGLKVTSFTATPVSGGEVDLSWSGTGKGLYGYVLTRNGKYVDLLTTTTYKDYDVKPKTSYVYQLAAQDSKGHYSPNVTESIRTPAPPPLSRARFAGSFDTRFVYVAENYVNRHVGQKFGEKWNVVPKCGTGACSVTLKAVRSGARPAALGKSGSSYHGSGSDTESECHGNRIREPFTVALKVTQGQYQQGVWRVEAFSGTQTQSAPAAFGCNSSSGKESFTGHLV